MQQQGVHLSGALCQASKNVERAEYRLAEAQIAEEEASARVWFGSKEGTPERQRFALAYLDIVHAKHIAEDAADDARMQFAVFCGTEDGPGRNHDRDGSTGR
jgi:hypothetical protein